MIFLISLILIFFSVFSASAAGGGEVPVSFIFFQALNFICFLGIILFILRKKGPAVLRQKHKDYLTMKERAQNLYNSACAEQKALKNKISDINKREDKFEEELSEAVSRAQKNLIVETKQQCLSILKTAQNLVDQKWMKIKTQLEKDFLSEVESLCEKHCRKAPPAPVDLKSEGSSSQKGGAL